MRLPWPEAPLSRLASFHDRWRSRQPLKSCHPHLRPQPPLPLNIGSPQPSPKGYCGGPKQLSCHKLAALPGICCSVLPVPMLLFQRTLIILRLLSMLSPHWTIWWRWQGDASLGGLCRTWFSLLAQFKHHNNLLRSP